MNPHDPNLIMLQRAVEALGTQLCEQLVFVGGAVAGLLITDPAQQTTPQPYLNNCMIYK